MENYKLADAVKLNKDNPESFKLPPVKECRSLRLGDFVKLLFVFDARPGGERMWVQIIARSPNLFLGRLCNVPKYAPKIKLGDPVLFKAKNIIQIMRSEETAPTNTEDGNINWVHLECNDPQGGMRCWGPEEN